MKIARNRYWGYLGLATSLSIIFVATISPFNFVPLQNLSWQYIVTEFRFGSYLKDYWQNILLFIPYGFSISIIVACKQQRTWLILSSCLLASLILSTTVELTQLFLPSRISNVTDIIFNSVGGFYGGFLYCWRLDFLRFFTAIITGKVKRLSYKTILLVIFTYCLIVSLATISMFLSVNLSNWDNYYLLIGNEADGKRPWHGYIKNFYISDRALQISEVEPALSQTKAFFTRNNHLVGGWNFDIEQKSYNDLTKQVPPLVWNENLSSAIAKQNNHTDSNQPNSTLVDAQHWLKTSAPAGEINSRLKDSSEFAIAITFATSNLSQTGPARIFAISQSVYVQNIVLGQENKDLYFRLRTPITGRNATDPQFVIPNVLNRHQFHRLLIDFQDRTLTFYLDRLENKYSYTFNPDNSYSLFIPWNSQGRTVNLSSYNATGERLWFYSGILIILGCLLSILFYSRLP